MWRCGCIVQTIVHIVYDCPLRISLEGVARLHIVSKGCLKWLIATHVALWQMIIKFPLLQSLRRFFLCEPIYQKLCFLKIENKFSYYKSHT